MTRVQLVNLFYSPKDKNYVFRFIILKTDLVLSGEEHGSVIHTIPEYPPSIFR